MRFRSLVIWVVVIGLLVWAGFTIVHGSSSYFEIAGVVDHVAGEAVARRKAAMATGTDTGRDFAPSLRAAIPAGAKRVGVQLDEVNVSDSPSAVQIDVKWSYPAVVYNGTTYLSLPLSLSRTIRLTP
jgi:hypothetical protein